MQNRLTQKLVNMAQKMFTAMRSASGSPNEELVEHIASILWVDRKTLQKKLFPKQK